MGESCTPKAGGTEPAPHESPLTRIAVIGTGTAGDTRLSDAAIDALQQASRIIGSTHQFAAVESYLQDSTAERHAYPRPLSGLKALLSEQSAAPNNTEHPEQRLVVLASGDPLYFGIGAWLGRNLGVDRLQFFPNISSVQSAFARVGLPWQDAQVVSLHGRPLISLRARLQNHRRYALLTDDNSRPAHIAAELVQQGFNASRLWVCEDLGGPNEQISAYSARGLAAATKPFHPLNVVLVETDGRGGYLPEFPGIRDADFITGSEPGKGMLSKREVRLNILALLAPQAGETGWDVGAGCGGVAVEWARWNRLGKVYAIEYHPDRLPHLQANRERFGVTPNLTVVAGMAPAAFTGLPDPDTVFVGGSSGDLAAILQQCWERLRPGGRLVCAAVTEDTRVSLHQFAAQLRNESRHPDHAGNDPEWVEIAVSRGEKLGARLVLRPQMPVLLVRFDKGDAERQSRYARTTANDAP